MVDLTLYNSRKSAYHEQTKDYELISMKEQIKYEFKSNPSYFQINYNGTNRDIHLVDNNRSFTKKVGEKKLLGYPDDSYNQGEYIILLNKTWLILSKDEESQIQEKCYISVCNNTLKWKDKYGALRQYPCVINATYSGTQIDYDQTINIPSGRLAIGVQYNDYTKEISINDRFIFGKQAYRVESINDFLNNQTISTYNTPILYIGLMLDSIAEGDDLVNGIAVSNIDYTISLDTTIINQSIGYTTQLVATVKRNGDAYTTTLTWTSSNPSIATVDNNGNVSLISNGSCIISVKMTDNPSIVSNCNVTVQAVPTNVREVRITPNVTELLQNQSQTYTCQLYVNGVLTPSTFTFVGSGATSDKYVLTTINGNSFSVKNIKMSTSLLTITASNDVDNGTQVIKLKGAF